MGGSDATDARGGGVGGGVYALFAASIVAPLKFGRSTTHGADKRVKGGGRLVKEIDIDGHRAQTVIVRIRPVLPGENELNDDVEVGAGAGGLSSVCQSDLTVIRGNRFVSVNDANTVLEDPDFSFIEALQTTQQNFVTTDPSLPDNPIL